jgi:hypothetical protein
LPRSRGRRILEAINVAVVVLPDAHRLLPTFARWHSLVPTVARGPLEVSVERVEAQVDRMSHDDVLMTQGLHYSHPCLSEFATSATR